MMIGAGGAGKTSLRHGLMKKRLPKMAFSTLLANCLSVKCHWAGAGGSSGQNWVEIDDDDEINELATLLAEILDRKSLLQSVESASAVKDFQPFTEPQQQQLESIPMDHTEAVDKIRKKVFTKARLAKMHNQSQFEVLLNLWDSGGQLVFMNILPAFLTRRTLFMLVFNASKSLEEKLQVVTVHAGKIVNTVDYHLNTSELLMQWMASIDAHLSLRIDPYPRVMLIGTHLDQLVSKGCSPTVETERILNSLHSQYKDKTYADLLMPSPGYIVDNTTAGQEDKEDPAFKEIRKCIHEFATTNLAVRTPITWVFFRKVMQTICQPDKPVMNYSEVIAIAEACSIPPSTLPSVLNFYHELGVFMYYSKIRSLRDVIIVNPQWLINHTAKLLTPQGLEDRGRERYWNLLRTKGILTEILYKEILKHGVLSPQALVDMLEHFLLAVPIETTKIHPYKGKEYFVPCMLDADSVNTEVSLTHKVPQTQAKPMHIIFNTHYVPPGFYVRLLASVAEDSHCRILFEKINCYTVTFLYKEVDKIKLIEHTDSIEVQVTRASEGGSHVPPFSQTCQDALELMSASIQKVYTWLPGVSADSAFKCSSCSSDLPRHFVIFDQSTFTDTTVPCQKENLQQLGQCPLQQCWLKLRDESMVDHVIVVCLYYVYNVHSLLQACR